MAFSHQNHHQAINNVQKSYYNYHRNSRSKSRLVLREHLSCHFAPGAAGGLSGRWVRVHPVPAAASLLAVWQKPGHWPPVMQWLGLYYYILITAFSAKGNLPVSNFHALWINWWGDANLMWNLTSFNLNSGTRSWCAWLLWVFLGHGLGAAQLLQLSFALSAP